MSDLTFPLIGLTTLIGYMFSQDGKTPRTEQVTRSSIEQFDKPNGKTIYSSNVVNEANDEILERSLKNYRAAEKPAESGYIPPLFNTYSVVGNDSVMSPALVPDISGLTSEQLGKLNNLNRLEDVISGDSSRTKSVDERPMFRSALQYIGSEIRDSDVPGDISLPYKQTEVNLLTGKPFEKSHANMVPFFGSNVKQNIETFSNESLLDSRAGNTSTFRHKRETGSFYDREAENIYGAPVFSSQVEMDRYVPSLYRQNERPAEPERISAPIAGTFDNNIRPVFKDVNELRPGNRPKLTYNGKIIAGQRGEVRGVMGEFAKHRADTFYENKHVFVGPAELVAPKVREDYSINMKNSARQTYNAEYYGNHHNGDYTAGKQRLTNVDNSEELSSYFQTPKRTSYENDFSRNVDGSIVNRQSGHDYGRSALQVFDSERASTGERTHLLNARIENGGPTVHHQDLAKMTIKQTTMIEDNPGHVASAFNKGSNSPYNAGISDVTARSTNKEHLIDNKYSGQAHIDNGLGYLVVKPEAKTTGKEMVTEASKDYVTNAAKTVKNSTVHSTYQDPQRVRNAIHPEYSGNAAYASESESRKRFANAYIRDNKQDVLMGERPSGPQKFQIASGKESHGDIKSTENMLLREHQDQREKIINDYKSLPDKAQLGILNRFRKDDELVDTVVSDRLQPDLVHAQLDKNPYYINTTQKL